MNTPDHLTDKIVKVLSNFSEWLETYGETSWDFQSFYAGPVGGRAKALYYRYRLIGTAAVAPMIFCEAFLPSARRLFHHRMRFPIADAHYAMGFAFLYEATGESSQLENAMHFLVELKRSRCRQFKEYCWGYPFDWVWRGGVIKRQTPLITTRPMFMRHFFKFTKLLQQENVQRSMPNVRHSTSKIDLMTTSKFSSRSRGMRQTISRTSGHRKLPAVVPTLLSVKAESSMPRLTGRFC